HNIPSVFLFNGVHDDYHQATDEVNKIEFDALQKRTQLAFVIAWELANRKNRPVVDKSVNQALFLIKLNSFINELLIAS
ncbi:MAG: hypothetical protein EBY31_08925, partial [Flavobacteriia bacterium]|nr:hypothetical protein [Flavobacteriia bacterium]